MKKFQVKVKDCPGYIREYETISFYKHFFKRGSAEVSEAIRFFCQAGKDSDDLLEAIDNYCCGLDIQQNNVDLCLVAWDAVSQEAISILEKHVNYEIDIYTDGNDLATSYTYKEGTTGKLQEAISKLSDQTKEELQNNEVVMKFLQELEITSF